MQTKEDVYEVIKQDQRFSILTKILENTGIGEAMSSEREAFTFFAPTDDAFRRLSKKRAHAFDEPRGHGAGRRHLGSASRSEKLSLLKRSAPPRFG